MDILKTILVEMTKVVTHAIVAYLLALISTNKKKKKPSQNKSEAQAQPRRSSNIKRDSF
ncbi:hypothetical protein [Priestia megaterium]|uniref:hypothetical protein n=1 Tax=Priestia megaterium TaxID=1404 RepID=UPI0027A7ED07|nr:hypothetical protein [Priestia megaterium]WDC90588.1 hypothetical protein PSR56_11285 [Priestia megaterium]